MTDRQAASLADAFERALGVIRARVSASESRMAVAYSGGLDSAALLHLAHEYATVHGIGLFAFHIHHGLSPNADAWLQHCEKDCVQRGIRFDARRVNLIERGRDGIEQAARISRYAALGELCRAHGVPLLITAHHQDDQAETVLLQLLRGSGVAGLSGMEIANTAPDLLGDSELIIGRPLLGVSRAELERFVAQQNIGHVEDESNSDFRYARNALRHNVMPSLDVFFPGFQKRIARSAQHAQSAQRLLTELAEQDLAACADGDCIDIEGLRRFGMDRIDNLLRHWFALRGVRMPSTTWLREMRTQLLDAKEDAQVRVTHPDCEIRRYRSRIHLTQRLDDASLQVLPIAFRWQGESFLHFPSYGGSLHFDPAAEGLDAAWLRTHEMQIRHRSGGETLKPAPNRPTRSLKHHYQALNIPAWERLRLPVIMANRELLYAAGIGMNWRNLPSGGAQVICLRWEKDII